MCVCEFIYLIGLKWHLLSMCKSFFFAASSFSRRCRFFLLLYYLVHLVLLIRQKCYLVIEFHFYLSSSLDSINQWNLHTIVWYEFLLSKKLRTRKKASTFLFPSSSSRTHTWFSFGPFHFCHFSIMFHLIVAQKFIVCVLEAQRQREQEEEEEEKSHSTQTTSEHIGQTINDFRRFASIRIGNHITWYIYTHFAFAFVIFFLPSSVGGWRAKCEHEIDRKRDGVDAVVAGSKA